MTASDTQEASGSNPPAASEAAVPATVCSPTIAPGEVLTAFRVIRLDAPPVTPTESPTLVDVTAANQDGTVAKVPASSIEVASGTDQSPLRAVEVPAPKMAQGLAAARAIALSPPSSAKKVGAATKNSVPALETKLAAVKDPADMLRVMDVEVALYRARRLSGAGDKQREILRVLSILLFCALVVALLGGMWYLQTVRDGRMAHRPPAMQAGR